MTRGCGARRAQRLLLLPRAAAPRPALGGKRCLASVPGPAWETEREVRLRRAAAPRPWVWVLGAGAEVESQALGGCCDLYLQVGLGGGEGRGEAGLEC